MTFLFHFGWVSALLLYSHESQTRGHLLDTTGTAGWGQFSFNTRLLHFSWLCPNRCNCSVYLLTYRSYEKQITEALGYHEQECLGTSLFGYAWWVRDQLPFWHHYLTIVLTLCILSTTLLNLVFIALLGFLPDTVESTYLASIHMSPNR